MSIIARICLSLAAAALIFSQTQARAQSPAASQSSHAFEVASIRENPGPWHVMQGYSSSGTRLTLQAWSTFSLIMEAYDLKIYQVIFSPSDTAFYDIAAKAEGDGTPTRAEFRPMLQRLLADRFNLKFHRETREMPIYALVVGKNGPKFKESAPDSPFKSYGGVNGRNQYVEFSQATMEMLADRISGGLGANRPILDKTGLTGKYDLRLEATPEFRIEKNPQPDDLSIFDAVRQQLGLKLEPQKAKIAVFVVDHIEKPSPN